jgi:hypothetical protein
LRLLFAAEPTTDKVKRACTTLSEGIPLEVGEFGALVTVTLPPVHPENIPSTTPNP